MMINHDMCSSVKMMMSSKIPPLPKTIGNRSQRKYQQTHASFFCVWFFKSPIWHMASSHGEHGWWSAPRNYHRYVSCLPFLLPPAQSRSLSLRAPSLYRVSLDSRVENTGLLPRIIFLSRPRWLWKPPATFCIRNWTRSIRPGAASPHFAQANVCVLICLTSCWENLLKFEHMYKTCSLNESLDLLECGTSNLNWFFLFIRKFTKTLVVPVSA